MLQPGAEQLVVRQHERYLCRLTCQVRVGEQTAEQVVFARNVGDGSGALDTWVVDCSRGGMGLESTVFLPRGSRLKVRVISDAGAALEVHVRVQRAAMQDRSPTYYLGVSFAGSGDDHTRAVDQILALARAHASKSAPTKEAA
jgi:hypothetical protein